MRNSFPKRAFLLLGILCMLSWTSAYGQVFNLSIDPTVQDNFYTIQSEKDRFYDSVPEEERKGLKQYRRWEHFWAPRVYPSGKFPGTLELLKDWNSYQNSRKDVQYSTQSKKWKLIGPITRPSAANSTLRDQGLGRVNILRFHKDYPDDLWAGAATGGVWRSQNAGKDWEKFPFTQFLSLGVSDIQIAPSNHNVVYVATGDMDGSSAAQNYYGIGIIKTTDKGQTWEVTSAYHELEERKLFGKMFVDPLNENVVVATSNSGILKTTDGGKTWNIKQSGFFIDLEYKPDAANVLYASTFSNGPNGTEIYKSTDMGETWKQVLIIDNTIRTAIEVSPANPNIVYALCAEKSTMRFHSFWVSEDAGETWDVTFTINSGLNLLGWANNGKDMSKGQGQFDLALAVSPLNENEIYVGGVNIWKSTNGGFNWTITAHWTGSGAPLVHADQHDLKFSNDGKRLYASHDGGIDVTLDGGKSWSYLSDGMSITQYYKIGITEADPGMVIGGSQDNGTFLFKNNQWTHVLNGDGMDCAIDPKDPSRVYGSLYYGNFHRSINGGTSFSRMIDQNQTDGEKGAWVAPIAIDPQRTNVIYVGYNNVWRSFAYGNSGSFTRVSSFNSSMPLQNIVVSPTNSDYVYATNYVNIWRSSDGGNSWGNILNSDLAVSGIAVCYDDPEVFYFTKSGYQRNNKVWKFDGQNAINLSGNLPNVPANSIVLQKDSPDRLYIGTDVGAFYSDYNSNIWELYGDGLPNVVVNDIDINHASKTLFAGTWGRGVWTAPILECNMPQPEINIVGETTFCQGDSVTLVANVTTGSVLWTTGETTKSITVKTDGTFSFVHSDGSDCNAKSKMIRVSVSPVPEFTVSASQSPAMCIGDSVTFRARPGLTDYRWNTGETNRNITVSEPGEYFCTASTSDGCEVVSEVFVVSFHPIPSVPTITEEYDFLISSPAGKYRWYRDGNLVEDATEQKFRPMIPGDYKVEVAESGDCFTMSETYELLVGVREEWDISNNKNIEIHPNPTSGIANIRASVKNAVDATISITNVSGREVLRLNATGTISGIIQSIDMSHLPNGTYIVTVSTAAGSFSERIIKQ